jgi:hypothetical protein
MGEGGKGRGVEPNHRMAKEPVLYNFIQILSIAHPEVTKIIKLKKIF